MSKKKNDDRVRKEELQAYFREGQTWETQRVFELEKSRRVAWRVCTAAVLVGLCGIAAATVALFRDPPDPVLIRVDNSTGIVDTVTRLKEKETTYEEVVNKYFLQMYVRYREGYSRELATEYYTNVGLLSGAPEQRKYAAEFSPKNEKSPLNLYGDVGRVRTKVKSISFIKQNVALVRYSKIIERGGENPETSHWAATITFSYFGSPAKDSERAVNPLGFRVAEYRNDPDSSPDVKASGSGIR